VQKLNIKDSPAEKLVYGLFPLPDYAIFSETLKYLLENDMCKLEMIHAAVTMTLGGVFRGFVQSMTAKRQEAANMINSGDNEKKSKGESLKEFAKLNVNSSYGKNQSLSKSWGT